MRKRFKLCIDWLEYKSKESLKQRSDFPFEEKIKTMDRLATIQEQKIVEIMVRFSISKKD